MKYQTPADEPKTCVKCKYRTTIGDADHCPQCDPMGAAVASQASSAAVDPPAADTEARNVIVESPDGAKSEPTSKALNNLELWSAIKVAWGDQPMPPPINGIDGICRCEACEAGRTLIRLERKRIRREREPR